MVKTRSLYLTWPWIRTRSWQTDSRTDRIPMANTRSQQYLPVQLWRVKMKVALKCDCLCTVSVSASTAALVRWRCMTGTRFGSRGKVDVEDSRLTWKTPGCRGRLQVVVEDSKLTSKTPGRRGRLQVAVEDSRSTTKPSYSVRPRAHSPNSLCRSTSSSEDIATSTNWPDWPASNKAFKAAYRRYVWNGFIVLHWYDTIRYDRFTEKLTGKLPV